MDSPMLADVRVREAQHLWQHAVECAATTARIIMPKAASRIDEVVALIMRGAVTIHDAQRATVMTETEGMRMGFRVGSSCQCRDILSAPYGQCPHRLARSITMRARRIARERGGDATVGPRLQAAGAASRAKPAPRPSFRSAYGCLGAIIVMAGLWLLIAWGVASLLR
jgi:hypothetical protein